MLQERNNVKNKHKKKQTGLNWVVVLLSAIVTFSVTIKAPVSAIAFDPTRSAAHFGRCYVGLIQFSWHALSSKKPTHTPIKGKNPSAIL